MGFTDKKKTSSCLTSIGRAVVKVKARTIADFPDLENRSFWDHHHHHPNYA